MKRLDLLKKLYLDSSLFILSIMYLELIFILLISKTINVQLFINITITSLIISKILSLIISFFKVKIQIILISIFLFIIGLLFSIQGVFYKIFKVFFSIYNFELSDQLNSFASETIILILKNSIYILLFFIPFILFLVFKKKIKYKLLQKNWDKDFYILITLLIWIGISIIYTNTTKYIRYSNYDLSHNTNSISLNIKRLGVLNTYGLEIKKVVFGIKPQEIKTVTLDSKPNKKTDYEANILNLNFKPTDNNSISIINNYIQTDQPTYKNEYTGMFKGYNLIYITAEGFSEIGIDEKHTPTLYKLTHSGFIFNNFYTPNNLSTIGGEFQSLTGLYPDYSILNKWREGTNYFPFGLANNYRKEGYNTYAYHNNDYTFQNRDNYLLSQGFDNFLACYNGLEKRINCNIWPQSDDEMIKETTSDYINNSPFMTYYMTVSGHMEYTFDDNYMSYKNKDLVSDMNVDEESKAYVASQIELDKALERLINSLEQAGILDKTVIVLMADHYPYGLDNDSINNLSTYYRDEIEVNHNALIIWNNKLEDKIIDKPCMSIDVLPTVYNLFGIDYDSRLFQGKDILSRSFGIAVMEDRSWVTDKGTYYASLDKFVPKTEVEDSYIENVNAIVNNRLNISRMIIETDYYKYLTQ